VPDMTVAAGPADSLFLVLDLTGTFAFALNGALTAMRSAKLDIVGVVTLAVITAVGGGIIRDVLLGAVPPASFSDYRYLLVAAVGGLVAFRFGSLLDRLTSSITLFDAAGLGLFAVTGASKALDIGIGPVQAVILGVVTGVGGGTLRDCLTGTVPTVLSRELYAIPATVAAGITVLAEQTGFHPGTAALLAAATCVGIRWAGVRFDLHAPRPSWNGDVPEDEDGPVPSPRVPRTPPERSTRSSIPSR
jgi:uncharacterized membrane protein YeiH